MSNELEKKRDTSLQAMGDAGSLPAVPELDLSMEKTIKIPFANLSALGVAFRPLTAAIQTAITGGGGSGIYFVNTMGKQMFTISGGTEHIGSLKSDAGTVGGGQARMTALACDPTMLFMAAALINIEKKLDTIQETQKEILEILEEKERATLQGNLNVLGDVMSNFKYNWNNETYKTNKHILVQDIKKEAEASIIQYRERIAKELKKRSPIHSDQEVKATLKKLQVQLKDYQLSLYLYAFAAFLEVMLLGNFEKGYLDSVEQRISEYSLQYRTLYTACYNLMEDYSKSSIQSEILGSLSAVSKFVGETIAKAPGIKNSKLDENLIEASNKLDKQGNKRVTTALEGLSQTRMNVTLPFVENIRSINNLYNTPITYFFDKENLYIQQTTE